MSAEMWDGNAENFEAIAARCPFLSSLGESVLADIKTDLLAAQDHSVNELVDAEQEIAAIRSQARSQPEKVRSQTVEEILPQIKTARLEKIDEMQLAPQDMARTLQTVDELVQVHYVREKTISRPVLEPEHSPVDAPSNNSQESKEVSILSNTLPEPIPQNQMHAVIMEPSLVAKEKPHIEPIAHEVEQDRRQTVTPKHNTQEIPEVVSVQPVEQYVRKKIVHHETTPVLPNPEPPIVIQKGVGEAPDITVSEDTLFEVRLLESEGENVSSPPQMEHIVDFDTPDISVMLLSDEQQMDKILKEYDPQNMEAEDFTQAVPEQKTEELTVQSVLPENEIKIDGPDSDKSLFSTDEVQRKRMATVYEATGQDASYAPQISEMPPIFESDPSDDAVTDTGMHERLKDLSQTVSLHLPQLHPGRILSRLILALPVVA